MTRGARPALLRAAPLAASDTASRTALPPLRATLHPLPKARPFARAAIVGPRLLALIDETDVRARIAGDPLELPHRYTEPLDIEVAALLSAALAYGRVDLFKPRLAALLERLGPHPGTLARDSSLAQLQALCHDFSYRMTGPAEVAALLAGAGRLAREHGTLGAAFACYYAATAGPTVRAALGLFVDALCAPRPGSCSSPKHARRMKHLLPHPARGSACKRLNLFLRWMVRGPDGVDFGLWRDIPPSALVIPLDTHVHRIAGFVGLTRRGDLSWQTAEEITARLRALDPLDPVRFDFSLSHLGISGSCPSRRDDRCCHGCPLQPVCKHWS